ncbi:MAG: hypothetical protein ACIPMY_06315 [Rickettsia endosymbiont of Pentastiridius leporinus]
MKIYGFTPVIYNDFFKFSSNINRVNFPIIIPIVFWYIAVSLLFYNYYDEKVKNAKSVLLDNNYKIILESGLNKLQLLALRVNIDLQSSNISLNNNYIKVCENETCIEYSFNKFHFILDQSVPKFNNFRIELNNKLLYSNNNSENYEIERTHYLNQDNKLVIKVGIDNNYWNKIVKDIRKPLWAVITYLSIGFIILCYLFRALLRKLELEYKNKYETVVKNCEKLWMTKLWDIKFNKTKDVEINCLFSQEAAKITLLSENNLLDKQDKMTGSRQDYSEEKLYCSIALYNPSHKEEIDIQKLIKVFTSRFDKEDENISFSISCFEKQICFSSTAAFYQIIYRDCCEMRG